MSRLLALLALSACHFEPPRAPHHVGVLVDRSSSVPVESACALARALAETGAALPDVDSRAALLLFATGDGTRSLEPLGRFEMPIRAAGERHAQAALDLAGLLTRVDDACAPLVGADVSPLYLSLRDAVAELRGLGCDAEAPCTLLVASDLQEGSQREIRARLAGRKVKGLPPPIDATGVAIQVCGVGATLDPAGGRLDAALRDRTEAVWRELVDAPEGLAFQPTCPTVSAR